MIGLVLVSHSKALAMAIRELVRQMVGSDFPVAIAAGVGDDHEEIGTDAVFIAETLKPFCEGDGAVVLMDLGSAVLSAQTAIELLDAEGVADTAEKLRLCPAPIVEAAIVAAVQAKSGGDLDLVAGEAMTALAAKQAQLGIEDRTASPPPAAQISAGDDVHHFDVVIDNPHGLHARPAARLVQCAHGCRAEIELTNVTAGRGPASARSLTSIGLLQVRKGDTVRFVIRGPEADAAASLLRQLASERFGETSPPLPATASSHAPEKAGTGGVGASEGIAIGPPLWLNAALPDHSPEEAGTPEEERRHFDAARGRVAEDLAKPAAEGEASEILAAQALVLSDPALVKAVYARIAAGVSARTAWREESSALAAAYAGMDDDYLRARAADLRDIARRVERILAGVGHVAAIVPDPPAILLTDELLPSEAMACDPARVLGVLARSGSPMAHAAIIIRTLGIPMVVGAQGFELHDLSAASSLAIDGSSGEVWVEPDGAQRSEIEARQAAHIRQRASFEAAKTEPAVTLDGAYIEVLANVGNVADAVAARQNGAEGVGLLRTEFVYLAQQRMPDDDEQAEALAAVLAEIRQGPVVVRTPDIGADKPLPFIPSVSETNPFLGVRGLRLSLQTPEFFASNLRAILRAGLGKDLWIMFPMVSTTDEVDAARAMTEQAHADLEKAGLAHCWPVKLGIMVEVPATALLAQSFAPKVDFFSIGTNDLTQYILAAERGNDRLDALQDAVHPAVLRIIGEVCRGAAPTGCHVSVCGDAASDPMAAALLVGAGVRSLSARPNQVAAIKAQIRRFSLEQLRRLAGEAMLRDNSAEVRLLAQEVLGGQHSE